MNADSTSTSFEAISDELRGIIQCVYHDGLGAQCKRKASLVPVGQKYPVEGWCKRHVPGQNDDPSSALRELR